VLPSESTLTLPGCLIFFQDIGMDMLRKRKHVKCQPLNSLVFSTVKLIVVSLCRFLDYLATLDDVYVVSVARALDWVRNPTALDTITSFAPWQVVVQDNDCSPTSCRFPIEDTPGFPSERYMTCCTSCPNKYPWLDNPLGDNTFRANKFDRS
jgi:hypothetical protein